MDNLFVQGGLLVTLTWGIVEVIKKVTGLASRWVPLIVVPLAGGLGAGYAALFNMDIKQSAIAGLIWGFTAIGANEVKERTVQGKVSA